MGPPQALLSADPEDAFRKSAGARLSSTTLDALTFRYVPTTP
jgi:hypothetical protein